ncbi:hypothetical protein AB0M43_20690 [Longispora sp. NPDC051575]|uniref:alpha/beta hydrolase n=1 Tax=Longispora sp. NPDC051575 TaxID=3154943 RepID=UPI00342CABC9
MRRTVITLALLGLLAGCTGTPKPGATPTQSPKAGRDAALPGFAFAGCVKSEEGRELGVPGLTGAIMGKGDRAVVFSNTADGNGCDWVEYARELVAQGYQVAVWTYGAAGGQPERSAELKSVVEKVRAGGAKKVALVGGSRGGCLSVIGAAEIQPAVAGVGVLSCAKVYNRDQPTDLAPWTAKLTAPTLYVLGDQDPYLKAAEAEADLAAAPATDKKLLVLPGNGAHGDGLLNVPEARKPLTDFLNRVTA